MCPECVHAAFLVAMTNIGDRNSKFDSNVRSYSAITGGTYSSEIVVVPPLSNTEQGSDTKLLYSLDDPTFTTMFNDAGSGSLADADKFFNSFSYVQHLREGNYSLTLENGVSLLTKCKITDPQLYDRIHKGAAFYWLGMAAFLVHDYETAVFFFDSAVSEDIRANKNPLKDSTPSFHFILIEEDQPAQAALALVMATADLVERALFQYNGRPGRSAVLELNDIREGFLRPALSTEAKNWRSLATTFISFFLEWEYRRKLIDLLPRVGTAEPFFLHLFKGCVLFESLLKANRLQPTAATTLDVVLNHLSSQLAIGSQLRLSSRSFSTVISDLQTADDQIQTAIEFTGKIRNTTGHNLGWSTNFASAEYHRLAGMVASSCLHAIASVYPQMN